MSLNVDNFTSEANKLIQNIAEGLPNITQTIAQDAIAQIKNRIQEKGEDADGKALKSYSTTEVPAFFFYNKATNEGGRRIIKERQKEKKGLSYKDFKAANNGAESVATTNLTFTGDMFRKTRIIEAGNINGNYVVTIGGASEFADNKAYWNSLRYGDILRASKEEEENAGQTMNDEIQKIINNSGF